MQHVILGPDTFSQLTKEQKQQKKKKIGLTPTIFFLAIIQLYKLKAKIQLIENHPSKMNTFTWETKILHNLLQVTYYNTKYLLLMVNISIIN